MPFIDGSVFEPQLGKVQEMNTRSFTQSFWKSFLVLAVVAIGFTACNRKIAFTTSSVVPGADGAVKVKRDDNGNHAIDIEIRNLADPQRLALPQNTYVVWMESDNGLKNLGQLKSETGLLTKARKAEMETVTPYKPTRIFITAETDGNVQTPGNQVVLSTRSF